MKPIGKIAVGLFFVILVSAVSHAADVHKIGLSEKIKIAWDATTTLANGRAISNPDAVGYFVYICQDINKTCEKSDPQRKRKLNENPIAETVYELPRLEAGQYFVGVKAVLYQDEHLSGEPIEESSISWSCSKDCTNNTPFCIKIGQ